MSKIKNVIYREQYKDVNGFNHHITYFNYANIGIYRLDEIYEKREKIDISMSCVLKSGESIDKLKKLFYIKGERMFCKEFITKCTHSTDIFAIDNSDEMVGYTLPAGLILRGELQSGL